jgi:hypothetical protein
LPRGRKYSGRASILTFSSLGLLLLACAPVRAEPQQLFPDVTGQLPASWKLTGKPNRGGSLERLYALPNGCGLAMQYSNCPDCEDDRPPTAELAEEVGSSCCSGDQCLPVPAQGHVYTCDANDDAVPPSDQRTARLAMHRREDGRIFDTVVFQYFFAKQKNPAQLFLTLHCAPDAYAKEKPELDEVLKTVKNARDIGPPKAKPAAKKKS